MAKRITIEKMREVAESRGGKCLSIAYLHQDSDLEWECSLGHKWKASSGNVSKLYGTWCPECAFPFRGERIVRAYFESILGKQFPKTRPDWLMGNKGRGLELDGYCEELGIAFEHQGVQHYNKIKIFGKHKNDFEDTVSRDVIKRRLCKKNGVILIEIPEIHTITKARDLKSLIIKELLLKNVTVPKNKRISIDWKSVYISGDTEKLAELKRVAKSRRGRLISKTYLGSNRKYIWECKEGHQWKAVAGTVLRDETWCAICSNRVKHGIKKLQKIAILKGGMLISKRYFNAHHKYLWECKSGHQWKTTASNVINKGYWCPECAREKPSTCCVAIVCIETGTVYESVVGAAKKLGIRRSNLSAVLTGRHKSIGGLHFKYHKP